jgi:hypothetical protein
MYPAVTDQGARFRKMLTYIQPDQSEPWTANFIPTVRSDSQTELLVPNGCMRWECSILHLVKAQVQHPKYGGMHPSAPSS